MESAKPLAPPASSPLRAGSPAASDFSLLSPLALDTLAERDTLLSRMFAALLCLVTSLLPLMGNLPKRVEALYALVMTAVVAAMRKLRLRRARATERSVGGGQAHDVLHFRGVDRRRHRVLFLGEAGVGKSSLSAAIQAQIPVERRIPSDGLASADRAAHTSERGCTLAVIVWTAQQQTPMKAYALKWRTVAYDDAGPATPVAVVCNMSDVAPCPMPEIDAMRGTQIPALAISALRGTNLAALWVLLEHSAAHGSTSSSPPSTTGTQEAPKATAATAATASDDASPAAAPLGSSSFELQNRASVLITESGCGEPPAPTARTASSTGAAESTLRFRTNAAAVAHASDTKGSRAPQPPRPRPPPQQKLREEQQQRRPQPLSPTTPPHSSPSPASIVVNDAELSWLSSQERFALPSSSSPKSSFVRENECHSSPTAIKGGHKGGELHEHEYGSTYSSEQLDAHQSRSMGALHEDEGGVHGYEHTY
jgi:hypothetical protein